MVNRFSLILDKEVIGKQFGKGFRDYTLKVVEDLYLQVKTSTIKEFCNEFKLFTFCQGQSFEQGYDTLSHFYRIVGFCCLG